MNKDIEDALRMMLIKLKQVDDELDAICTQYGMNGEQVDALSDLWTEVGSAIREIERILP